MTAQLFNNQNDPKVGRMTRPSCLREFRWATYREQESFSITFLILILEKLFSKFLVFEVFCKGNKFPESWGWLSYFWSCETNEFSFWLWRIPHFSFFRLCASFGTFHLVKVYHLLSKQISAWEKLFCELKLVSLTELCPKNQNIGVLWLLLFKKWFASLRRTSWGSLWHWENGKSLKLGPLQV